MHTPANHPRFKSKGMITLPSFKMDDEKEYFLRADGELTTADKTGRNGAPETDGVGGVKTISTLVVTDSETGLHGIAVIGAIGASSLRRAGVLQGRFFRIIRHKAPTGRPKVWTIEEVEAVAPVDEMR